MPLGMDAAYLTNMAITLLDKVPSNPERFDMATDVLKTNTSKQTYEDRFFSLCFST
jgi:hypothetical protein